MPNDQPKRNQLFPVSDLAAMASPEPPTDRTLRGALLADGYEGDVMTDLVTCVGGIEALEQLDTAPLPTNEPFDWSGVAEADRASVTEVLACLEQVADVFFPRETFTIARRLLARVAVHGTDQLGGGVTAARTAAALVWLALQGNQGLGRRRDQCTARYVWTMFKVGDSAAHARRLLQATGLLPVDASAMLVGNGRQPAVVLPDPRLLSSSTRHRLCAIRDQTLDLHVAEVDRRAARRTVTDLGGGRLQVRAHPVHVHWAYKGLSDTGRAMVMLAMGGTEDEPDVVALSIPQAHELVALLQHTLDTPLPQWALGPR